MLTLKVLRNVVGCRSISSNTNPTLWLTALQQLQVCTQQKFDVVSPQMSCSTFVLHSPVRNHSSHKHLIDNSSTSGAQGQKLYHGNTLLQRLRALQQSGQVRNKSRRSKKKSDEDDEEEDSDADDALDEDDFEAPENFKTVKSHFSSLRADVVVANSLNISRHQIDELFLSSSLLLNGEKVTKKSVKMDVGDYIDVVLEKLEDQYKIKRAKVIKIYSGETSSGKTVVKMRVWKTPFMVDAPQR